MLDIIYYIVNSQVILLKISSNDSFISESKNRLIESKKRKKIFEISHLKISKSHSAVNSCAVCRSKDAIRDLWKT